MNLAEMTWMEVEQYLKKDDRIMVVLGANEQHGYICLSADVRIPQALAEAASDENRSVGRACTQLRLLLLFHDISGNHQLAGHLIPCSGGGYRPLSVRTGF